jgi:hypothetical protein
MPEIVMYSIILFILIGWSIVLLLSFSSILEQIFYTWNNGRVVFLPTDLKITKDKILGIIKKYDLKTEVMPLIELGCGRAGFLRSMSVINWKEKIGIEGQFVLSIKSKVLNFGQKIKIIHGDIFNFKIPKNSLVYCYLGIKNMNELYKSKELNGSAIISLDYAIEGVEPQETISLSNKKVQNTLYFYDFR